MPTDNINNVVKYRRLPSFEETHLVMGGCIVVEREDVPQFMSVPPEVLDNRRVEAGSRPDDLRYER